MRGEPSLEQELRRKGVGLALQPGTDADFDHVMRHASASHLRRSKSPPLPLPSPPLPPVHFPAASHCNALLRPAVPNPYPPSNTSMPAMLWTSPNVTSPSQRMIRCVIRPALLLSVHAISPLLLCFIIQAYELSTLTGSF